MLLGLNNNLKYKGRVFHIQTEDSGVRRPHVISHLFCQGVILASVKTDYSDKLSLDQQALEAEVREIMKRSHREMIRRLVSGAFDSVRGVSGPETSAGENGPKVRTVEPAPGNPSPDDVATSFGEEEEEPAEQGVGSVPVSGARRQAGEAEGKGRKEGEGEEDEVWRRPTAVVSRPALPSEEPSSPDPVPQPVAGSAPAVVTPPPVPEHLRRLSAAGSISALRDQDDSLVQLDELPAGASPPAPSPVQTGPPPPSEPPVALVSIGELSRRESGLEPQAGPVAGNGPTVPAGPGRTIGMFRPTSVEPPPPVRATVEASQGAGDDDDEHPVVPLEPRGVHRLLPGIPPTRLYASGPIAARRAYLLKLFPPHPFET